MSVYPGDVVSGGAVLPPYTVTEPGQVIDGWPIEQAGRVVVADVTSALADLPRAEHCGHEYVGLAVQVGAQGDITLLRCAGGRKRRVWQVKW